MTRAARFGAGVLVVVALLLGVSSRGRRAHAGQETESGLIDHRTLTQPGAGLEAQGPEGQGQQEGQGKEEGEGEHQPEINGKNLGLQLLNFAVLLFILIKFGGGAINKALLARHQQLKADLASAAEARAAAEQRLTQQEARLASLEHEIAAITAGIKQEAEAEKARLIEAAEERARRIGEETKFMLDQQVKEAEATLRREMVEAAVRVAEQLVRGGLDGRDQQRLVDAFVTDVAAGGAAAARPAPRSDG